MSLQNKLDSFKADFEATKAPPAAVAVFHRATAELIASRQAESALKIGDRAPSFNIPDANGSLVDSAKLLLKGPLVLTYAEVNPDYTHRPDPSELLPTLQRLRRANAA